MTVRHTPLTARLSPATTSGASDDATRRRKPPLVGLRSTSSPTASTRPVNISLYQHIGPQLFDAAIAEVRGPESSIAQERHTRRSQHVRRDVQPDEIDQSLVPGARVQRRPTFEQQGAHAASAESIQRRAERLPGDVDLRSRALESTTQVWPARRLGGGDDDDRPGVACREDARPWRSPKAAVENDARQWPLTKRAPRRQQRIVAQNRPDSHADSVDFGTQTMR